MWLSEEQRLEEEKKYPEIDDPEFFRISRIIGKHTISDLVAQWAFYKSIAYVVKNNIPGDIMECGVWNGGSILLAAYALLHFGDTSRRLYLYDTFEGMPRPSEVDVDITGNSALKHWETLTSQGKTWGYGGTEEMVRDVVFTAGYPQDRFVFVKGLVEDTIPATIPERISILRLDTDFYTSTYHELVHAYPLLSSGGVLIIDDYGYFLGSRLATDKYIAENQLPLLLNRINSSVHLALKL
jgi:hypothetical protein